MVFRGLYGTGVRSITFLPSTLAGISGERVDVGNVLCDGEG
jgi:hypothetical protein